MNRVICIGDSIRKGYEPTVIRELEGWADVIAMEGIQGGNTRNVISHLDEWAIQHRPDIVHFNAGLHDMARDPGPGPVNVVPLDEYRANVRQILETLQRETSAALIFALTTPVDLERQLAVEKAVNRTCEDVTAYNEAAAAVAAALGVAVNDLHSVVVERGAAGLLVEDGVHFTDEGSEILGRAAAAAIRAVAT